MWLSSTEHIDSGVEDELACDCVFHPEARSFQEKPIRLSVKRGEKMTVYPITSLGKQTLTYLYSLVVLQLVLNMRYRHYVWNSLGLLNL